MDAPLTVVTVRISALLDRSAESLSLERYKEIKNLSSLDPEVGQAELTPGEIPQPDSPTDPKWCVGSAMCLKTSFPISNPIIRGAIRKHCHSPTLDSESEVRIFSSGEIPKDKSAALIKLSLTPAPLASLFEQNIFKFNCHEVRYGKMMAFVQPVPDETGRSLLTGYLVFAFETRTWNGEGGIARIISLLGVNFQDIALGKSFANWVGTGLLKGIPDYSKGIASKIVEDLAP